MQRITVVPVGTRVSVVIPGASVTASDGTVFSVPTRTVVGTIVGDSGHARLGNMGRAIRTDDGRTEYVSRYAECTLV